MTSTRKRPARAASGRPAEHAGPDGHNTPYAYETNLGLERIVFFSDAVMAIAITLLVIELHVPEIAPGRAQAELAAKLLDLVPQIGSFVISFVVVGVFWMTHHRMFGSILRYDRRLMWINLLYLLCLAFIPFPTAVVGLYGNTQVAVILYALSVLTAGLVKLWLWRHATAGHRLVDPALSQQEIRYEFWRSVDALTVFPLSIIISFFSPTLALYSWLLLIPVTLVSQRLARK